MVGVALKLLHRLLVLAIFKKDSAMFSHLSFQRASSRFPGGRLLICGPSKGTSDSFRYCGQREAQSICRPTPT
jgi:hypothetical protein